jgi:acyl carrier protein
MGIKEQIFAILEEIRPENDFRRSEDFIKEGLLDSFDIVQLVDALDEVFGISIDGLDILPENFHTAEKIIALLNKNGVINEAKISE